MKNKLFSTALLAVIAFVVLFGSTVNAQDISTGLLAHYPLDGDATDATGNGNHGTESGVIVYVPGVSGQAAQLNGNEQIGVPNFFSSTSTGSSLSISLWMNTVTTKVIAGLVTQWTACSGSNTDDNFSLQVYNNVGAGAPSSLSLNASRSLSGSNLNAPRTKVTDGDWHHVSVTYENGTGKLYVDGNLEDQVTSTSYTNFNPNVNLVIGGYYSDACTQDGHYEGDIDDVRIYDRALSASDIQLLILDATDTDGDGFAPPEDCNDNDASINPDAVELPGDVIDQNCDGDLGACDPCLDWKNHGHYVRCTAHAVEDLVVGGFLSDEEGDALITSSAQSEIGKKSFVPEECTQ